MTQLILSLRETAILVAVQALQQPREPWFSGLLYRLRAGEYAAVAEDVLQQVMQSQPARLRDDVLMSLVPASCRTLKLSQCQNLSDQALCQVLRKTRQASLLEIL